MTKSFLPALLLILLAQATAYAQGPTPRILPPRVEDAIRFTSSDLLGSARFVGTGGSMTAVGVDATVMHTNPAGIGWNRSSYATVSGGFSNQTVEGLLRGNGRNGTSSESVSSFSVPNVGLVYVSDTRSPNWQTLNFGFSLARVADFNETISYRGDSEGSILDAFVEDLNDNFLDPTRSALILDIDNTLFDDIDVLPQNDRRALLQDPDGFFSDFDYDDTQGAQITRSGSIERTGSMNELALSLGGNYNNKLLWGASIGIPFFNFTETRRYEEIDTRDEVTRFEDASFDEILTQEGSGANLKLGLIYIPTQESRISFSVHTPTFWTVDETFSSDFTYNYSFQGEALGGNARSDLSIAVLNLRTPWRFSAGGGYLLGRKGFLSVDADYVNYGGNSFSFNDFIDLDEPSNNDVEATLGGAFNVRAGGEINLDPLQVRFGVGYQTLPTLEARFNESDGTLTYSGGLGYNAGKFFVDVAARYTGVTNFYAPYRSFDFDPNLVDTDRTRITGVITVGYRGF